MSRPVLEGTAPQTGKVHKVLVGEYNQHKEMKPYFVKRTVVEKSGKHKLMRMKEGETLHKS